MENLDWYFSVNLDYNIYVSENKCEMYIERDYQVRTLCLAGPLNLFL